LPYRATSTPHHFGDPCRRAGSLAERLLNIDRWLDPKQFDARWERRCVGPLDILLAFKRAEA
jgi:hypothetical protein